MGESEIDRKIKKIRVIKKQGINYKQYVPTVWEYAVVVAKVAQAAAIYLINILL